jgi:hypothetical protein
MHGRCTILLRMRSFPASSCRLRDAFGLFFPVFLGVPALPSGCCRTETPDAGETVVEVLSPVPVREGLIGDLSVSAPGARWIKSMSYGYRFDDSSVAEHDGTGDDEPHEAGLKVFCQKPDFGAKCSECVWRKESVVSLLPCILKS